MKYCDQSLELDAEFWAYRHKDLDSIRIEPVQDFWTVSLGSDFSGYLGKHPDTDAEAFLNIVSMNIAECLFRWPIMRAWNPFQATAVRVLKSSKLRETAKIITLPPEWRVNNG